MYIQKFETCKPEWIPHVIDHGIEATWRLGKWDLLDQYMAAHSKRTTFESSIGALMLSIRKGDGRMFEGILEQARNEITAPLVAASMESYSRSYNYITQLHALDEIEAFQRFLQECKQVLAIDKSSQQRKSGAVEQDTKHILGLFDALQKSWAVRLDMVSPSISVREPLLNIRRALFGECQKMFERRYTGAGTAHPVGDCESLAKD